MMNRISVDQTAKSLHLTSEELCRLMAECGIVPDSDGLTLSQADQVMQYARTSATCCEFRARRNLENVVRRFTLFLDACTILDEQFHLFVDHITPVLQQYRKAMVVPSGVVTELQHLFLKKEDLRQRVADALELLEQMEHDGLVEIYGAQRENFGDQQLLTIATCVRMFSEALFITKDRALSEDILKLNQLDSVKGSIVAVSRINRMGYLSRYIPLAERERMSPAA